MTAGAAAGHRAMPPSMIAVISCISTYGIMLGLSWPLISLILEARGINNTIIGANAAMVSLGTVLVSPLVPGWLSRFGARRFAIGCILAEALLFLALPAFDNLFAWFVIRFLMGASGTALFIASETWINALADDANRGRWLGLYNAVISATIAVGPLLLIATGTHGWLPFVAGAIFILLAGVPLAWAREVPQFEERGAPVGLLSIVRGAPAMSLSMLLVSIIYMAGSALLPVYGVRLGLSQDAAALLVATMMAGSVLAQWPAGWACDRFMARRAVLIVCSTAGALFGMAIPLAIDNWTIWPVVFCWGGFSLSVYTVTMTLAGDRFKGTQLAQAMAVFGILWGMGALLGPAVGGAIMDLAGPHGLPVGLSAAAVAFALFAAYRGIRRTG